VGKHRNHLEKLAEKRMAKPRKTHEIISHQSPETLEISTPVIEVCAGVLVAHLNGKQASQSMQQLMELLLERIVEMNSLVAVVDMTDVQTIDTEMAQNLINAIGAVRLLGPQVVLAGAHPAITQTLEHLDGGHSGITICSSLAAGLWVALDIVELESVSEESRQVSSSGG